MDKPQFVYVTYISTTPERVWNALIDPEMTRDYWGRARNVSDWKVGSTWQHQSYDDANVVDVEGVVVESDPPHRLVLTWSHPAGSAREGLESRVTFEIEPFMDAVKLTVIHTELNAKALDSVSRGWPAILSSLKTLLETGQAMPMTMRRWAGAK